MKTLARALRLLNAYLIAPATGRPSTAAFWYTPDPPNLIDQPSLDRYLTSTPSPHYIIDYRSRTAFPLQNRSDIVMLPYGGKIGNQVNPEAAFQVALGFHDLWKQTGDDHFLSDFLRYSAYFAERQTASGDWPYLFDWYESAAPWTSALAQSRGASVMLRAWMVGKDPAYREAALKAINQFDTPVEAGGYLATFKPTGCGYFEEYPKQKNVTLNGFVASLFGLWEIGAWLKDDNASTLFDMGLKSVEDMLPYFTLSWWSLYDQSSPGNLRNLHSPRYHLMCTGYLLALSTISGSEIIHDYWNRWTSFDRLPNRLRAYFHKSLYKLRHR